MRSILILTFIFIMGQLNAQEFVRKTDSPLFYTVKTIKGQLKEGEEIYKNKSFVVRGRRIYGKTDHNGYFTLNNVTDNDVIELISPYKTFTVKSVTVSVISGTESPVLSNVLESLIDTAGVFYMPNNPSTYNKNTYADFQHIASINKNGLKESERYNHYLGFSLNYTSMFDISSVGKLPERQSEYAQGRNNTWQGAHQGEIFSWGPKVNTLEYDGIQYDYDKNGSLVPAGSGNGVSAKTFDPADFFRQAGSFANMLDMKFGMGRAVATISLGQRKSSSVIPNSYKESYNGNLLLEKIKTGRFTSNVGAIYKSTYDKLNEQSANISSLMYSILTTPPTFDNANRLSSKQAVSNNESWLLPNGTQRSYAINTVNNPYMLINNLPDRSKSENLLAYINTNYRYEKVNALFSVSYEKEWDKTYHGIKQYPFNHYTYRNEEVANIIASADLNVDITDFYLFGHNHYLSAGATYGFKHTNDKLNRTDDPQNYGKIDNRLIRNAHDIKYGAKIMGSNLSVNLYNKHYFSNTLHTSITNLFPEAGFNFNMENMLEDIFNRYINLSMYGYFGRSVGESSLVSRNLSALSTTLNAEDFQQYYEYTDLFHYNNLRPEIFNKSELGFRYSSYTSGLNISAELNGFYYVTHDFISPIFEAGNPLLSNIGRLHNYGYYIGADLYKNIGYSSNGTSVSLRLNFSQSRNKVSAIYSQDPYIRLAGFRDIASVFAKDEALGAIYGTTYLRNDQGQVVINSDGFPIVDPTIKKIGDPTPDFLLTALPAFTYKNFSLAFVLEYSHGGDRWNGTKAFMDYQGISENSGELRNTREYIFDGVNTSGGKNNILVDFYDPTKPIAQNRWVRYGSAGVGEDYIENASYFRLSEISASYKFRFSNNDFLKSIKLQARAHNLLFVSSYDGIDPSGMLFGYKAGSALDLFNMPSVKSYSFSVSFEF